MSHCAVIPVIHHIDETTTLSEAEVAFRCGANGVFLIAHGAGDDILPLLARQMKDKHPQGFVGINLLSEAPVAAVERAIEVGLDGVWLDSAGVSSAGLDNDGLRINDLAATHPWLKVFASVAFKYQKHESQPADAAQVALQSKFIPTTSGSGTGHAPSTEKIRLMSEAVKGKLAVASGMTCENVAQFAPYLSWILIATGISRDLHHLDEVKTKLFIETVRKIPSAF